MPRRKRIPQYCLAEIKAMADGGHMVIPEKVLDSAKHDFGWEHEDIVDAIRCLRPRHFFKSSAHRHEPGTTVDTYHARKLKGMNVYMHLHMTFQDGECLLILGSCKELEE